MSHEGREGGDELGFYPLGDLTLIQLRDGGVNAGFLRERGGLGDRDAEEADLTGLGARPRVTPLSLPGGWVNSLSMAGFSAVLEIRLLSLGCPSANLGLVVAGPHSRTPLHVTRPRSERGPHQRGTGTCLLGTHRSAQPVLGGERGPDWRRGGLSGRNLPEV